MGNENFFDTITEQSFIKKEIVYKYFNAWSNIMKSQSHVNKLAYIDLFSGPGHYKDGTKSTPILILEKALADDKLCRNLVTIFTDANDDHVKSLESAINILPGINSLKHKPLVSQYSVNAEVVEMFEQTNVVPTLLFADPWGYKGLSLRLIKSILKDWGCDCIFFFNFDRINRSIAIPQVALHMKALFGEQRLNDLHRKIALLSPRERELTMLEELSQALKDIGGNFILPFRFRRDKINRTSHYLIFITKKFRGYEIMKDIMAKHSSDVDQGVASFEYCPADRRQPLLFELSRPLEDLEKMLFDEFAGNCLTVQEVYEKHSIGRPYIKRNYKEVLKKLEDSSAIMTNPPASERRKGTIGDHVSVTFPSSSLML